MQVGAKRAKDVYAMRTYSDRASILHATVGWLGVHLRPVVLLFQGPVSRRRGGLPELPGHALRGHRVGQGAQGAGHLGGHGESPQGGGGGGGVTDGG